MIRELANLAGINCKIINGYGRTPTLSLNENSIPNHSWNSVELNGKWYLCDPTWSAGRIILEEDGPRFEADYFDSYFLAEPELFLRNHYPIKIENSLLKQAPTLNEFIAGPVVYRAAFKLGVLPLSPLQMQLEISTNEQLSFSLKASQNLAKENIELLLSSGIRNKIVKPNLVQSKNDYLLYYSFKKRGKYDVHIKIDDAIVATYVVKVKR